MYFKCLSIYKRIKNSKAKTAITQITCSIKADRLLATGCAPNLLAPSVPEAIKSTKHNIMFSIGIKSNKLHQPLELISCKREIFKQKEIIIKQELSKTSANPAISPHKLYLILSVSIIESWSTPK